MLFLASTFVLCAYEVKYPWPCITKEEQNMQDAIVRELFRYLPDRELDYIANRNRETPVCGSASRGPWQGLTCLESTVVEIKYEDRDFFPLRIQYLPSGLQVLDIKYCNQRYEIDTRYLPRSLTHFDMSRNLLVGDFSFPSLPPRVRSVNLAGNVITGKVTLAGIPLHMEWIDIQSNPIHQSVVYYHNLPETFQRFVCVNTKITALKPINAKEVLRQGIFIDTH